jgi:hypothetical protein
MQLLPRLSSLPKGLDAFSRKAEIVLQQGRVIVQAPDWALQQPSGDLVSV